jgi:hypothetical protein
MDRSGSPNSAQAMRVRITKTLAGSIDGIQLSHFTKGQVYDVYTSLACYLLSEQMAEPAPNDQPTAQLPIEKQMFGSLPLPEPRKTLVFPRSIAADRPGKNEKNKKD